MRDAIVVAGGWSASRYNLRDIEKRGTLVGINDAAVYLKADIAITRDRLWLEHRAQLLQTLGVPEVFVHEGIVKNTAVPPSMTRYSSEPDMAAVTETHLFDTNSATAALSLMLVRKPKRVFLFGFDMQLGPNKQKHWYPDYTWAYTTKEKKLNNWAQEYKAFAFYFKKLGIEVYNVNHWHYTRVIDFPIISFEDFLGLTV